MQKVLDNTARWNEAAKGGALLGAVSVGCLCLKEWAGTTESAFLMQAAAIVLWAVEFFGCILLMKKLMLDLRDRYEGVKMEQTYKLGRRVALLSGLLLASAQALFILRMPPENLDTLMDTVGSSFGLTSADRENLGGMLDRMPLYTFLFQWAYCFLYGTVLSSILSRYIFLQRLLGGTLIGREFPQPEDQDGDSLPEEQNGEPEDPSGAPEDENHGDAHRPDEQ